MRRSIAVLLAAVLWTIVSPSPSASAAAGTPASSAQLESPLPVPTGDFAVARTHVDWVDSTRTDSSHSGGRAVSAWIWYPAAPVKGPLAEWLPGREGEEFWSSFVQRYPDAESLGRAHPLAAIRTHAHAEARVAAGTDALPLILFAPGLGVAPLEYAGLIEDLASHGYVVVGLVGADLPASPPGAGGVPDRNQFLQQRERLSRDWADDLHFLLDRIGRLDSNGPIGRRVATKQVGILGHSLGGTAAFHLAESDDRVGPFLDIDGLMTPEVMEHGPTRPVLVLSSGFSVGGPLADYDSMLRKTEAGYHLRVAGTFHMFAGDIGTMPFVPASAKGGFPALPSGGGGQKLVQVQLPLVGSLDPVRALGIVTAYANAFFDQYLRGRKSELLDGPSARYPEVTFEFPKPGRGDASPAVGGK